MTTTEEIGEGKSFGGPPDASDPMEPICHARPENKPTKKATARHAPSTTHSASPFGTNFLRFDSVA